MLLDIKEKNQQLNGKILIKKRDTECLYNKIQKIWWKFFWKNGFFAISQLLDRETSGA